MKRSKTCECKHPLVTDEDGYCSSCARYTEYGPMPEPPPEPTIEEAIALVEEGHAMREVCMLSGYSHDQLSHAMNIEYHRKRKRDASARRMAAAKAEAEATRKRFPEIAGLKVTERRELALSVILTLRSEGKSWEQIGAVLGCGRTTALKIAKWGEQDAA